MIALFLKRLLGSLTWPRFEYSAPEQTSLAGVTVLLSPDDLQVLEQILARWAPCGPADSWNSHEIIEIALRRLQSELDCGHEREVIEDLQREIDYRLWCARNG